MFVMGGQEGVPRWGGAQVAREVGMRVLLCWVGSDDDDGDDDDDGGGVSCVCVYLHNEHIPTSTHINTHLSPPRSIHPPPYSTHPPATPL